MPNVQPIQFFGKQDSPDVEKVYEALSNKGLTRTQIHGLLGRNKSKKQIDEIVQPLLAEGVAQFQKTNTKPGRPREVLFPVTAK